MDDESKENYSITCVHSHIILIIMKTIVLAYLEVKLNKVRKVRSLTENPLNLTASFPNIKQPNSVKLL